MQIRNTVIRLFLIAMIFGAYLEKSIAQEETKYSYWVGAGFGPAAIQGADEVAFGGSGRFAFAWSQSVVSLSAGGGGTTNVFGTNDEITILTASLGQLFHADDWTFRLSVGPAYMKRIRRSSGLFSGNSTDYSEFGVSVETEAMFRLKVLGLGLVLSGAISENTSVLLVTFNASLGSWNREDNELHT